MVHIFRRAVPLSIFVFLIVISLAVCQEKVRVSTLPKTVDVLITIYQAEDLTFVQERYFINLEKGTNTVQFDWETARIDPSSLNLRVLDHPEKVVIEQMVFSPHLSQTITWKIRSSNEMRETLEISYFTQGLSWKTDYSAVISSKKNYLSLGGWVTLKNQSGRDYSEANIRLVLGEIHLLEKEEIPSPTAKRELKAVTRGIAQDIEVPALPHTEKKSISEYHLFRIEGRNTLRRDQVVRLSLFSSPEVALEKFYLFNLKKFGRQVRLFYGWKNEEAFPLPSGLIRFFKEEEKRQNYLAEHEIPYVSPGQIVELNLRSTFLIRVERKLMDYQRTDPQFSRHRDLASYREEEEFHLSLTNVLVERALLRIREEFPEEWKLLTANPPPSKKEANALEFQLQIEPGEKEKVIYRLFRRVRIR